MIHITRIESKTQEVEKEAEGGARKEKISRSV